MLSLRLCHALGTHQTEPPAPPDCFPSGQAAEQAMGGNGVCLRAPIGAHRPTPFLPLLAQQPGRGRSSRKVRTVRHDGFPKQLMQAMVKEKLARKEGREIARQIKEATRLLHHKGLGVACNGANTYFGGVPTTKIVFHRIMRSSKWSPGRTPHHSTLRWQEHGTLEGAG